jgi:RNA polymerase subunit RPABC4/transcription elongation factor Spt4
MDLGGSWQNAAALAATLGGAYVLVFWISVVAWTYRDIRERSRDAAFQVVAVLLVLVFNFLGLVIYLILRPRETLAEAYARSLEEEALLQELEEQGICPSCKRYITGDFVICPYCRTQLKEPCIKCGRPLSFNWLVCPYCTTSRSRVGSSVPQALLETPPVEEEEETVEQPKRRRPASSRTPVDT